MTVDLVPEWTLGDLCLTSYPYGVDADSTVDIGEPEMVVEGITSHLPDGDLERVVRHGNRTYVIPFYIMGASLGDLAEAEALLRAEMKKTGLTLAHDAGDGFTPVSVYEVSTAALTPERDDTRESHLIRRYTLTLTCAPWAMSADLVNIEAMVAGSTTVTIDTCDSATGWTGTRSGASTPVLASFTPGSVGLVELDNVNTSPETWTMTRTGSVDFTTTPLLVAELKTISTSAGLRVTVTADGVVLPVLETRLIADGMGTHRVTFDASSLDVVSSLTFSHTSLAGETWQGLFVRDLKRTDIPPNVTARQLTRIIRPGGTERTPASIRVTTSTPGTPLSTTLVHTSPSDGSGYSPPLRRWRTSGNGTPTTDVNTLSGSRENIHPNPFVAKVPTSALPEDGYELVAFLRTPTVGEHRIYWNVGTLFPPPNDTVRQGDVSGSLLFDFPVANRWEWVSLGLVTLPTIRTGAGTIQIDILRDSTDPATVEIDEAWLFRVGDDCALSVVNVSADSLWLDSASVTSPEPTVWIGDSRESAAHPGDGLFGMGHHVLSADGTALFVGSSNVNWPSAAAELRRRWHSNAAE